MSDFKTPWGKKYGRKLKIFGVPWHVAHQYELMKIPETEWFFLKNHTRKWSDVARPEPDNLTWVSHYEPGTYDFALVHVDQQCVYQPIGKGKLFRELNEVITDIPKILICHGTPFWPEMYGSEEIIKMMSKMIGPLAENCVMNSERSVEMWGFGHFIRHGISPEEWPALPKEPRIVTSISPGGLDEYYNRKLLKAVQEDLRSDHNIRHCHVSVDVKPQNQEEYSRFIGSSLIYFNPTLESCMPRSRTEALMTGACVVTLNNHDIGKYLVDGESGFFVKNNPKACVDKLVELFYDYETCIKVGMKGREVALKHFTTEQFIEQWISHISNVLNI